MMTVNDDASRRQERVRATLYAGMLGTGILVSRFLGLARDIFIAYFLGTGHAAEAWVVAFRIPNVLRMHLSEGSLNSAFVPVLNQQFEQRGHEEARKLINAGTSALTLLVIAIALIGAIAAPFLVRIIAPGFAEVPGKLDLTATLMQWTFLYLLLATVAALFMGVLQSVGYFVTSAIAPALFNITLIVAIFTLCPAFGSAPERWVYGLIAGSVLAGAFQLLMQLPEMRRRDVLPIPTLALDHPGVRRIATLMVPTLLGVGVSEFAIVANTFLASLLSDGAMAAIEYATRVAQVPYMVCAGALSTAMLPLLARQSARGDFHDLSRTLSQTIRAVVFLMAPISVLTAMLATPAVQLLFERGAFSADSTLQTARSLRYFAPLIVGASVYRVLVVAFFSQQDTRTPVVVSLITLVFNIVLGIALMGPMDVAGLSLAVSLAPCVGSVLLMWMLWRRVGRAHWTGWTRTSGSVGAGCVALFAAAYAAQRAIAAANLQFSTLPMRAIELCLPAAAGLTAYLLVGAALRAPELSLVHRIWRNRRSRIARDERTDGHGPR